MVWSFQQWLIGRIPKHFILLWYFKKKGSNFLTGLQWQYCHFLRLLFHPHSHFQNQLMSLYFNKTILNSPVPVSCNQDCKIVPAGSLFTHSRIRNRRWNHTKNYSYMKKFIVRCTLELNPQFSLQTRNKSCLGVVWGSHGLVNEY